MGSMGIVRSWRNMSEWLEGRVARKVGEPYPLALVEFKSGSQITETRPKQAARYSLLTKA